MIHGCTKTRPPTVALRRLANGYQVTQAIHVAAALGIADLLRDGPRDSDALAQETATHAPSLHRVLRALASVGVLHEGDDGRFALTAHRRVPALRRGRAGGRLGCVRRPALPLAGVGSAPARRADGGERVPLGIRHRRLGLPSGASRGGRDLQRRDDRHHAARQRPPARGLRLRALRDRGRRRRWARRLPRRGTRGQPRDARDPLRPASCGRGRGRRRALRRRRRQLLRGGARGRRRLPAQSGPPRLGGRRCGAHPAPLPRGDRIRRRAARRRARPRRPQRARRREALRPQHDGRGRRPRAHARRVRRVVRRGRLRAGEHRRRARSGSACSRAAQPERPDSSPGAPLSSRRPPTPAVG